MFRSNLNYHNTGSYAGTNGAQKLSNDVSVFISPHIRSPNFSYQSPASVNYSNETSFDEIESLRAEVKRLSDIVYEQTEVINLIQEAQRKTLSDVQSMDRLDLLTELSQQKITLNCLERENNSMKSMIQHLKNELGSLNASVGQQSNELILLRNAIRDILLVAPPTPLSWSHEIASQVRSVSCSELQANGISTMSNSCRVIREKQQRQRGSQRYSSRLPPSGHNFSGNCRQPSGHHPPLKSASNGTLTNLVMLLKSPKFSLRKTASRSKNSQAIEFPILEDDFSSSENINSTRAPSLLLPPSTDFEEWSLEAVCDLLQQLGLGYCRSAARKWIQNGDDIINANTAQLQQNLGLLKPIHLKKLLIHVSLRTTKDLMATRETAFLPSISPNPNFNASAWLDDIGLPMYKSAIQAELIDAHVLHELTLSELQSLGVNNELHMISMRRGLQLMRQLNFDLSRLSRRPQPNTGSQGTNPQSRGSLSPDNESQTSSEMPAMMSESAHSTPALHLRQSPVFKMPATMHRSTSVSATTVCRKATPPQEGCKDPSNRSSSSDPSNLPPPPLSSVALWTCQRLESWLCEIELPEYASGLRSSGLHGALLVYEDRFTAETLASLLDIGPERTLLRRHLSEQFSKLLGSSIMRRKQRPESPLSPSVKLRLTDGRSSLKKIFEMSSGSSRYVGSDLLCPLEADLDFSNFTRENGA